MRFLNLLGVRLTRDLARRHRERGLVPYFPFSPAEVRAAGI